MIITCVLCKRHLPFDMRPQFSLDADTTEELEKLAQIKDMDELDVVKMLVQNELDECRNNPDWKDFEVEEVMT